MHHPHHPVTSGHQATGRRRTSQPGLLHLLSASKLETPSRTSGSGLQSGRKDLLCPRL